MPDEPTNELELQEHDIIDDAIDELDDVIALNSKEGTSITDGSSNT
jgi:hypothetical protein